LQVLVSDPPTMDLLEGFDERQRQPEEVTE
jgi:hypothetical protein